MKRSNTLQFKLKYKTGDLGQLHRETLFPKIQEKAILLIKTFFQ